MALLQHTLRSLSIFATFALFLGYTAPAWALAILETKVNPSNGHTYHLLQASTWLDASRTC